jgi:hypothetical protein
MQRSTLKRMVASHHLGWSITTIIDASVFWNALTPVPCLKIQYLEIDSAVDYTREEELI